MFVGAILIATVFGGISAEIQRAYESDRAYQEDLDYVYFSINIHSFDSVQQVAIMQYLCIIKEYHEFGPSMQNLQHVMNPSMRHNLLKELYLAQLGKFHLLKNAQETEIMYIAVLMQPRLNIADEEVIN